MIEAYSVTQALGDVLFTGNRVYRLAEPDRMLKIKNIYWDRETSDLEDEQGRVYRDVSRNDMEFAGGVEYHLPDDE